MISDTLLSVNKVKSLPFLKSYIRHIRLYDILDSYTQTSHTSNNSVETRIISEDWKASSQFAFIRIETDRNLNYSPQDLEVMRLTET